MCLSPCNFFSVSKELLQLFIQLDELEDSFLKKAVSILRQQLESAELNSVQVIDVEAIDNQDDKRNATLLNHEMKSH